MNSRRSRLKWLKNNNSFRTTRIGRIEENEKFISLLEQSFLNLKAQTDIWENNYLLVSPVDGTVAFTRFWSANQSVLKDEPVVNVIPHDAGELLGRMNLKMDRSGKVKTGQMVYQAEQLSLSRVRNAEGRGKIDITSSFGR